MGEPRDPAGLDKFRKMSTDLALSDSSIGNIFERMNNVMSCVINKGSDKSVRSAITSLKIQKDISMRDERRPNAIRNLIYQMVDPFVSSLEALMERERRDDMDDIVMDPSSPQQQPSPSAQMPPSSSTLPGKRKTDGMLGNIKREGETSTNVPPENIDPNRLGSTSNPQMPEPMLNDEVVTPKKRAKVEIPERPSHVCMPCGRLFPTKRGLDVHMRTHPLICSICNHTFTTKKLLALHYDRHANR